MIAYRHNATPKPNEAPAPKPNSRFKPGNKMGKGRPPRAKRQEQRLRDCPVCNATFFVSSANITCSRDCSHVLRKQ